MERDYTYYHAALAWVAAGRPEGKSPATTDINEPAKCGFYRSKGQDKIYRPVAYWVDDDGVMHCKVGERVLSDLDAQDLWIWVQGDPITYEVYNTVVRGGPWPDIDPTVHAQVGANRRGIGGNKPPDEATLLEEQIKSAEAGVAEYAKIESDEVRDRSQSLRSRLLELKGKADKTRVDLKAPHLKAEREIDGKWMPLVKQAQAGADRIRDAQSAWETAKFKKQKAEQEARDKAERERLAAEQQQTGHAPGLPFEPQAPSPPPAAPTPLRAPAPIRGAYGRAASAKPVMKTTVTDQDKVYQYFRDNGTVVALLADLAQKAVNAGQIVPGTTVEEERKVV